MKNLNNAAMVPVSDIFHREQDNVSRAGVHFKDAKDRAFLVAQLARHQSGWLISCGGLNLFRPADDSEYQAMQDVAVEDLQNRMADLKSSSDVEQSVTFMDGKGNEHSRKVTISGADRLAMFQQMHCTGKGKVIRPTKFGVNGFRRANVLVDANVVRHKIGFEPITVIPAEFKVYRSVTERYEDCIKENSLKNTGAWGLGVADRLSSAQAILSVGGSQASLRSVHGVGIGQKLYGILELNRLHPMVRVVEGILSEKFPWGALDKELVRRQMDTTDSKDWKRQGTDTEVEAFLLNPKSNKKNAVKISPKDEIITVSRHNANGLIALVCRAIAKNNLGALSVLSNEPFVSEFNEAFVGLCKKHKINPTA